jgi:hypothetical protein
VKVAELVAIPPGMVPWIFPVFPCAGTVAQERWV